MFLISHSPDFVFDVARQYCAIAVTFRLHLTTRFKYQNHTSLVARLSHTIGFEFESDLVKLILKGQQLPEDQGLVR